MKSEGSHGSSSLLFFMKVTVWHVVSDSQKVMTALLVMLPPKCWCGDFSAVSLIDYLHTHHQELMKPEWRVMTAHCRCLWWRWWWSDTLWMTLMKLWLHVILVMLVFVFARTDRTVTLKLVLWRFLCNLVDVWSLFCWATWEGFSGILFADAFLCSLGRICLMGILADWLVRQVPNPLVVATLVPIVGGVALASLTEASFNWYVLQTVMVGRDSIDRRLLSFFFFCRKQLHSALAHVHFQNQEGWRFPQVLSFCHYDSNSISTFSEC